MQRFALSFTLFFLLALVAGCSGAPKAGEGELPPEAQKTKGTDGQELPVL